VIYWLVNNVLSIAQQMLINRTNTPAMAKAAVTSKG
jgi:membrane protein insertase Oxa1/YidC/SpoIIIJ